jgi:cold shock CspA family protein
MSYHKSKLTRIGVFYDGNYFFHVSNYYQYQHARKARISIDGLHEFIRHQVAEVEGEDVKYCQIVDAHYFRGRPRAQEAEARGLLLRERQFDDILMREGVITHYLPLGPDGEKGIDVWLALETYELAIYKRFDVIVLIACDGDFLPLVRKLNALGARVMLLGWGFSYIDQSGKDRETRTAQVLLEEVTYPVLMHQIIDDRSRKGDQKIDQLFVPHKEPGPYQKPMEMKKSQPMPAPTLPANGAAGNGLATNGSKANGAKANAAKVIELPANDMTAIDMPINAPATIDLPANPPAANDLPANAPVVDDLPTNDMTTSDLPSTDMTANDLPTNGVTAANGILIQVGTAIGEASNAVMVGKIQALREGFGFITPNDGSGNLFFFHASVLNADFNELRVGDEVNYKIGNNDKGVCAVDVEIVV